METHPILLCCGFWAGFSMPVNTTWGQKSFEVRLPNVENFALSCIFISFEFSLNVWEEDPNPIPSQYPSPQPLPAPPSARRPSQQPQPPSPPGPAQPKPSRLKIAEQKTKSGQNFRSKPRTQTLYNFYKSLNPKTPKTLSVKPHWRSLQEETSCP